MKLVLTTALLGALFLISGCATQCESVCNQYDTCKIDSNPPQRGQLVDCVNFCGIVDAFNARAAAAGTTGCAQKWSAHITCWQQHISKICDTNETACDQSAQDWATCVTAYCAGLSATQFDPECSGGDILIVSPFQSTF